MKTIARALWGNRENWGWGQKRGEEECLQGREFLRHGLHDWGIGTVLGERLGVGGTDRKGEYNIGLPRG